jgi:membrane protein
MKTDKNLTDENKTVYGHQADRPRQIPAKGWKQILIRVKDKIPQNHIPIISAGIAFYLFLALFPALAALLSIYGLVMDPQQVQEQISQLSGILPEQGQQLLSENPSECCWSVRSGPWMGCGIKYFIKSLERQSGHKSFIEGVNIAYEEENRRSFIKETAISLLFTLAAIVLFIICITIIVAFPAFMGTLGLPEVLITVIDWVRWLILGLMVVFAIAAIYKFAPVRNNPRFNWVSWGAVIATLLWLVASWAFSFYVRKFGDFDETYGAVAAVIIMMLWLFLTSFLILIGAEINSEMEHQTSKDTTVGEPEPLGSRDAYHADRVAGGKKGRRGK